MGSEQDWPLGFVLKAWLLDSRLYLKGCEILFSSDQKRKIRGKSEQTFAILLKPATKGSILFQSLLRGLVFCLSRLIESLNNILLT